MRVFERQSKESGGRGARHEAALTTGLISVGLAPSCAMDTGEDLLPLLKKTRKKGKNAAKVRMLIKTFLHRI